MSKPCLFPSSLCAAGRRDLPYLPFFAVPSKIIILSICPVLALTKRQCSGSPWDFKVKMYNNILYIKYITCKIHCSGSSRFVY